MSLIWALLGVIIISLGGLISTRFWEDYTKSRKLKSCIKSLLTASILLLLGAYLSTYYWNEYFYEQGVSGGKKAMTSVLAAELVINESIIRQPEFVEPADSNLSNFVLYPRFQTSGLQAAIASCLFVEEEDKELFQTILDLNRILNDVNKRCEFTEKYLLINNTKASVSEWRKEIRDGETLKSANQWMNKLSKILSLKYIN